MAELGQTQDPRELVRGDPHAIEENVRVLRARGERACDAAVGLRAIDTGSWTGQAATRFHEEFSYTPAQWYEVSDVLVTSGEVLELYAETLRWAQGQAAEAIRLWNEGERATQQAKAQHDAAIADATRQNEANAASGIPIVITVDPFTDPGEASRQAARDILGRARHQLQTVGDESAEALRGLTPPEETDVASEIGHGLLDIAGFVPLVGEAADAINAGWYAAEGNTVAAGLSAAAAIPIAGWGAGGAKAVGKAADIAKAAGHAPAAFGQAVRVDYRKTFFEKHPELEGKLVVHHAVEQQAKKLYPDANISTAEMHSYENLRGIPKEINGQLHLGDIRKEWTDFYETHPNATKEELLDFATHIDNKYGHQFNPPIR